MHETHGQHAHAHGPGCGHPSTDHQGHVDYVHDFHRHAEHGAHWDEHAAAEHAEHDPHAHVHGEHCGHVAVRHAGHEDYEHDGHHHADHGGHWDEH